MRYKRGQVSTTIVGAAFILCLAGCQPPEDTLGTTIYTRKQTLYASIDAGGERLRGSTRTEGYTPQGSWQTYSSSDGNFYDERTIFYRQDGDRWLVSQDGAGEGE